MKNNLFVCVFALIMMATVHANGQNEAKNDGLSYKGSDIVVAESLLKFSEQMKFKYMDVLQKAIAGDRTSIKALLEYHGTTDGKDAINHAVTCLELILVANDENYAYAAKYLKPNLKKLLLDRFVIAQGRTQKTGLLKPMKDWAPMTWASLNGLPIPGECSMGDEYQQNEDGTTTLRAPKKPGQEEAKPALKLMSNPDAAPSRGRQ